MLKKIFASFENKRATLPQPPSVALQELINKQLCPQGLQPLPQNAQLAFQISTNPSTDAKDIIPILERDEALTAKILKVANSAYFNRGNKINSVKEAVHLIGLTETCSMVTCSSLNDLFPSTSPLRTNCWKHHLTTALIAKLIGEELRLGKANIFFTAGLLHDIGKLLLIQKFPNDYSKIYAAAKKQGGGFAAHEQQVFPFNHTHVGALIANKWNFSEEVLNTIIAHHAPWAVLATLPITRTVKLSDLLSHRLDSDWNDYSTTAQAEIEQDIEVGWSKFAVFPKKAQTLTALIADRIPNELEIYS